MGPGSSQRQLLEEMHKAYAEKYPERASQAIEILAKDYPNALEMVSSYLGEIHAADATLPAEVELPRNLVQTVRYIGRPQIHLYEHDSKNGTGCSLAGTIDQESITWQSVDAVDCKKCRYCRKAVFEVGPQ
ncbi:hypothetical protein [Paenibacillus sp. BK720]|uniref:hypothetical protein n=1 Tax=Paenibacillus sp. BK720 TaxID=2587092 RepID=UPI001ABA5D70|nr:hypothetical protein [Paenibacillus sp. BK720]